MPRGRVALLCLVALVLLVPAAPGCGGSSSSPQAPSPGMALVRIGDLAVEAEVPQTPEEFTRGLSGRAHMDEDRGMLFIFTLDAQHGIWMKGMQFPLDLIWISADLRVADISANVQPQPGVPDSELIIYRPQTPVLYVLEAVAGVAEKYGVEVGDTVELILPEEGPQAGAD